MRGAVELSERRRRCVRGVGPVEQRAVVDEIWIPKIRTVQNARTENKTAAVWCEKFDRFSEWGCWRLQATKSRAVVITVIEILLFFTVHLHLVLWTSLKS